MRACLCCRPVRLSNSVRLPRLRLGKRPAPRVATRSAARLGEFALPVRNARSISSLKHHRRQLLFEAGVKDEQEFRQRALECARAEMLGRERDSISREIEAALASQCSETAIRQQLESVHLAPLEMRRDETHQRYVRLSNYSTRCWKNEAASASN